MLDRLRELGIFSRDSEEDEADEAPGTVFTALRLFSAELLLSTGANATLHYLRSRDAPSTTSRLADEHRDDTAHFASRPRLPGVAVWAPLVVGSIASAVQTAQALQPSERTDTASKILNGIALGLGLVGAADKAVAAIRGNEPFSVAPLLFGYAGLLGFLLDRQENQVADEEAELARRARIVERFVPRRKTKIERVVVHV